MKGFETFPVTELEAVVESKKECPAMKGFETKDSSADRYIGLVRRNAPL